MKFSIFLPTLLFLPFSIPQLLPTPPYALRIHTLARDHYNLTNTLITPSLLSPTTLEVRPSSFNPPWTFNLTPGSDYELTNATHEMILLGEKVYMWDLEAAWMEMAVLPKEVAKTGYLGTPWPSVYITAKWDFNITRNENRSDAELEGNSEGRWWLEHGMEHGSWIVQPNEGDGSWDVGWWNGTELTDAERQSARVRIEVVSAKEIGQ